ncbi:MAG: hypothetical protein HUJ86_06780, partial [Synergistes sp.]|nr:hypothetical protein [Synergistes sp.]
WQPSTVEVEVFREVERMLPVISKVEGNPPEGMVVGEVKLNPNKAVVKGHENDVLSVQGLEAEVNLNELDKEGNTTANIIIKSAAEQQADGTLVTRRIKISPTKTVASVKFENEIVGERIPVKVSVVGEPLEGLQVESIKVIPDSVSIRGRSAAVKKMQSLVLPPVDITGLDQNIQLVIPMQPEQLDPDVEITGTDRARVEIRLTKKIVAKSFTNIPLAVEGADKKKEWKVTPHAVTLIIEGSQKAIDSLGRSGAAPCKLYVDVSDIVSDQMELPVLVKDLKKDLQIVRIEPEQVKVTTVRD